MKRKNQIIFKTQKIIRQSLDYTHLLFVMNQLLFNQKVAFVT